MVKDSQINDLNARNSRSTSVQNFAFTNYICFYSLQVHRLLAVIHSFKQLIHISFLLKVLQIQRQ